MYNALKSQTLYKTFSQFKTRFQPIPPFPNHFPESFKNIVPQETTAPKTSETQITTSQNRLARHVNKSNIGITGSDITLASRARPEGTENPNSPFSELPKECAYTFTYSRAFTDGHNGSIMPHMLELSRAFTGGHS